LSKNDQLQANVFKFCDVNHQCQAMSELCEEPLWYGEQPNTCARQLNVCCTLFKNKFKALKTLLKSAEYTINGKEYFCIHA
jgi:hypothetical protein